MRPSTSNSYAAPFVRRALTIIQTIPHGRGQFWKDDQIGDYLAAGHDFILIDTLDKTGGTRD